MVLYSAVSSPLDRLKRFTLSSPGRPVHSDTVLGFSWKHSSHAAIAQRLFTHISTTVYSQVLIYTAESTEASWSERKCPNFETVTTGFEPGLSRLRVRHSTNWATALHKLNTVLPGRRTVAYALRARTITVLTPKQNTFEYQVWCFHFREIKKQIKNIILHVTWHLQVQFIVAANERHHLKW